MRGRSGLGASPSAPLDFDKLREAKLDTLMENPCFPACPKSTTVICTFWLLRDLEATTAELQDMYLDLECKRVVLQLSMSKTDPQALGTTRTWGCVCGIPA